MHDREVREALHRKLLKEYQNDTNTLVLDELGLRHGTCRVDIAVVNGYLHGYEIKSDADTLQRLPGQVSLYCAVLDRATLVVGEKHAEKARAYLPDWWGVEVATEGPHGGIEFDTVQLYKTNPAIDPVALAELLWAPEAAEILRRLGTAESFLRKPRAALYRYLAQVVELKELRDLVLQALKSRARWRGQRPPSSDACS